MSNRYVKDGKLTGPGIILAAQELLRGEPAPIIWERHDIAPNAVKDAAAMVVETAPERATNIDHFALGFMFGLVLGYEQAVGDGTSMVVILADAPDEPETEGNGKPEKP